MPPKKKQKENDKQQLLIQQIMASLNITMDDIENTTIQSPEKEEEEEKSDSEGSEDAFLQGWTKNLENLSMKSLHDQTRQILRQYGVNEHHLPELMEKLADYHFIEEIDEFINGRFIRYIPLNTITTRPSLKSGGVCTGIKISQLLTCVNLVLFTKRAPLTFLAKIDENIFFMKCTTSEKNILTINDYLQK